MDDCSFVILSPLSLNQGSDDMGYKKSIFFFHHVRAFSELKPGYISLKFLADNVL